MRKVVVLLLKPILFLLPSRHRILKSLILIGHREMTGDKSGRVQFSGSFNTLARV